ncbi:hypothetical protein DSO57_1001494 [Entomophthora muscae]|uniref:Uncharacterized protein n=1 Tax=Entomophthora muscae TaxID=34485 RepID=A0ACC2UUJ8_9FUNG|nr:hypothetical protein DSO57_1001494 [Entomophthora muscae]
MKYIGWLVCVFAVRTPVDTLYKKQQTLDEFRFPHGVRPKIPRTLGPNIKVVSPGSMFEFNVFSNEHQRNVSQLITALQVAGGFLENAIAFNNPIKVEVTHGSYCKIDSGCPDDKLSLGI